MDLPMGEARFKVGTGGAASSIYVDGVIYFGGLDGVLYAVNASEIAQIE
jgi:outer membrane protein assembly factor BamB